MMVLSFTLNSGGSLQESLAMLSQKYLTCEIGTWALINLTINLCKIFAAIDDKPQTLYEFVICDHFHVSVLIPSN
jgi:hypothetical protein